MKRLLLILMFVVGCQSTPPTTELLVVVDSDVQPALAELRVDIFDRAGASMLKTHDFPLDDKLPLSFSLYPIGDASELRLVVTGRRNGSDVVEKQVIATFHREQRWLLSVFLAQSCVDVLCRANDARSDNTCTNGSCGPTTEATLTPAEDGPLGGYTSLDAGRSTMDARVQDARTQDSAPRPDAAPEVDAAPPGCVADEPCSELPDGTPITWPTGTPVGACKAGTRSCVDGVLGACVGAVAPKSADSCEIADDDSNCNGTKSENCQCTDGATRACGSTVGSCKAGTQTCANGRWGSTCTGGVTPASADTCDANNDANCNGKANDGCTCVNGAMSTCGQVLPMLGDCLSRAVMCSNGMWSATTCNANCNNCPTVSTCGAGTCVDGNNDYACSCPAGYTGTGTKACTFIPLICGGMNMGMDSGTGIACGPHTHCRTATDGGILGCECDTGFTAVQGSNPPACN